MWNLYRIHSIDASYQVADHWAMQIQRRLNCLKLTYNRGQMMDAKWWQQLTWPVLARWDNIDKRTNNDLQNTTLKIKD
jgi:hypothetical protein